MPARDLDLLVGAALEAGRIARSYFEGENRVWDKGRDDPVSEADLAVDRYLRETLNAARPDYGWLSEETEDNHERLSRSRVFVIDPIDGTRAFIAGESAWAHSLAVVEDGTAIAGVVYLPMKDRLYSASLGGGAALNGVPIRASAHDGAAAATLLASRPAMDPSHWPGGMPEVERHFRPSLAYRLSLVAQGRFDAMLTLRDSWEWDIAAGALIATEAGARATDRTGQTLSFNRERPLVAGALVATPAAHATLLAGLS